VAGLGDGATILIELDRAAFQKRIGDADTQAASEVVVARPCQSECLVAMPRARRFALKGSIRRGGSFDLRRALT